MALREGFTTGTAAAAAAKAAAMLLSGGEAVTSVEVPLPRGDRYTVAINASRVHGQRSWARVIKDGGDDPDATHGAAIEAKVEWLPGTAAGSILLEGGAGVGRVTRPGLPVAVGEWAINPAPREQIRAAVAEALGPDGPAVRVVISVPDGEAMAAKTLNPRLGIVGGISILGTRGTVKPFSHSAWRATIESSLDVARAQGLTRIALATGGRSERLLMARLRADDPDGWPDTAFIQAADYFAFSLQQAARRGFTHAAWGVFFGKLVKQAHGLADTHAGRGTIDFARLADLARQAGMAETVAAHIAAANTGLHALEMVDGQPGAEGFYQALLALAHDNAVAFAALSGGLRISYALFAFDGRLLGSYGPTP